MGATTSPVLFGECLGKVVRLSAHDVAEIMEHQAATRRRFGEIALAWGLCRPQHVWQAWWNQLSRHIQHVDLTKLGIDAQAVNCVPANLALQFRVVPLRCFRDQLVLATSARSLGRAQLDLPPLLDKQVQFVIADARQLDEAIAAYYPATVQSEITA
jgi:type IV pilus assembly protein PilB